MNSKEKKQVVTQKDIFKLLDSCYEKCLYGKIKWLIISKKP